MKLLPTARADRLMSAVRRKKLGDLSEFGLPEPDEGVVSRLKRLGVAPAIVDHEVIDAVKDGRIEVVAGVESLDEGGVRLADGTRIEPDALIAATGYRRGLEAMVGHLGVLGEHGCAGDDRERGRAAACASSATCRSLASSGGSRKEARTVAARDRRRAARPAQPAASRDSSSASS